MGTGTVSREEFDGFVQRVSAHIGADLRSPEEIEEKAKAAEEQEEAHQKELEKEAKQAEAKEAKQLEPREVVSNFRTDRSLIWEQDPQPSSGDLQIGSIKDADWRHQKAAMMAGYNSVAEYAIDELVTMVRDLEARVEYLEGGGRAA